METTMLVFSRKVGEGVVLPSCGVVVTVTRVAGKRVRLGVLAPPDVQVHRGEVAQRILQGTDVREHPPQDAPCDSAAGCSSVSARDLRALNGNGHL